MFGFGRKKKKKPPPVADTFVEATGGGWSDSPSTVAGDGGSQADYVDQVLEQAKDKALADGVEVEEKFEFKLTDIPQGISSPHEIIFGLMMRADEYGLQANLASNETVSFTRVS